MSDEESKEPSRRDFIYVATAAAGAITTGAAVWPLIDQMNPSADVQALASIEVDVAEVEPGSQITVKWLGKPVFIRRRTEEEIKVARAVDLGSLPDQMSYNANKPDSDASDENRTLDEAGEWLVMVGVCTHLGCVPLAEAGDFNGWFCPCHGSHYDTAGRIRKGPAPKNLPVPTATLTDDLIIKLG
jgi:ubiquinol-cytochrome c reductase iron-sulfur subunit